MAHVRLFAAARDAAGTGRDVLPGETVGAVLDAARARYGARFADVLETCRIWVNGEPADAHDAIAAADELAVLPPVSGGATADLTTADLTTADLTTADRRPTDLLTADSVTVDVPTEREPT